MEKWPVFVTVMLWSAGTIWYFKLVARDEVKPALAPWIIMSTTMLLGLISYLLAPNATKASGVGFIMGMFSTFPLLGAVVYKIVKQKREVSFNLFQKSCLAAAVCIIVIWVVLKFAVGGQKASFIANILTQVLMTVGYIALIERLWHAKSRVESLFFFWSMIFLGGLFSMIIPIKEENVLGIIYGIRSAVTGIITLSLLVRIEVRARASATRACQ